MVFSCQARIRKLQPTDFREWTRKEPAKDDQYIYLFKIVVEDETGELPIIIYDGDAVCLLLSFTQ